MALYNLGKPDGMHVVDLSKAVVLLRHALVAAPQMSAVGFRLLWLGSQDPQKNRINAGAYMIDGRRWIGGTLTNPNE